MTLDYLNFCSIFLFVLAKYLNVQPLGYYLQQIYYLIYCRLLLSYQLQPTGTLIYIGIQGSQVLYQHLLLMERLVFTMWRLASLSSYR